MRQFQACTYEEIQAKLEQHNYWLRIHSNKLLCKVQKQVPAKIIKDGHSQILSYYDEHGFYLCTLHRIITFDGVVIHENAKDAVIDGVYYRAVD